MRNITVKFSDGSTHIYKNAPDDITPEQVVSRANSDFSELAVTELDGGRKNESDNTFTDKVKKSFGSMADTIKDVGLTAATGIVRRSDDTRQFSNDAAIAATKSAIMVPETAVGAADLVSGGRAGKYLEDNGLRFSDAKQILDEGKSDRQKQADANFENAEGFMGKTAAAVQNPSVVANAVIESGGVMGLGGVVGRGLTFLVPKVAPVIAGAFGEGVTGAASQAESTRQSTEDGLLTNKQAAAAGASGLGTAFFGAAGGKIAQKFGLGDIDTILAGGAVNSSNKTFARKMVEGGVSEGVFEELPQSVQEQMLSNWALDKPVMEGVDKAASLGMLTGGVMGAAAQLPNLNEQKAERLKTLPNENLQRLRSTAERAMPNDVPLIDAEIQRRVDTPTLTRAAEEGARVTDQLIIGTGTEETANADDAMAAQLQAEYEASASEAIPASDILGDENDSNVDTDTLAEVVAASGKVLDSNPTFAENSADGVVTNSNDAGNLSQGKSAFEEINSQVEIPREVSDMLVADARDTSSAESGTNRMVSDTDGFANADDAQSVIVKGYGSIDIPTQRRVLKTVLSAIDDSEVFNSIVSSIPVDVMNNLAGDKLSTDSLFHDKSMFKDALTANTSFPILSDTINSLVKSPAFPIAKILGENSAGGLIDSGTAVIADKDNWHSKIISQNDNNEQTEWHNFPDESGTLGISREKMPQIKSEHRGAMVNFLNAREISHEQDTVKSSSLKPTQKQFSLNKVKKAKNFEGGNRSILVSSDNFILDGHHQWMSRLENDEPIDVIRLNAPIADLIKTVKEFPSATTETVTKTKVKPKQNTLLTAIKAAGGLTVNGKRDITGETKFAPGGYNQVFTLKSKQSLKGMIENGTLDDFLPHNMRLSASENDAFDSTPAYDYIAERMRNGDRVLPYEVELEAKQSKHFKDADIQADIDTIAELADDALINSLLKEAGYDERQAAAERSDNTPQNIESGVSASGSVSSQGSETGITQATVSNEVSGAPERDARNGARQLVESIVKLRAAANEIGKLKQFDASLKQAKAFMNGEDVKASLFKFAAATFKNVPELSKAYKSLYDMASPQAKAERKDKANTYETYKQIINDAKSVKELQAIARDIQAETSLSDSKVTELDELAMERMDSFDEKSDQSEGDLLGDDTTKAQAVADAERAKDDKRNAGDSNTEGFALTGSDRQADKAAARGAQDLFSNAAKPVYENIQDLGEKIGGARKDTAASSGNKSKRNTDDDRPAWAKRYQFYQEVTPTGAVAPIHPEREGKWGIFDSRDKNALGHPRQVGGRTLLFDTKEEAEKALPSLVVGLKHRVYATAQRPDGTNGFEIFRNINDRKRVKILDKVFDDREEALRYMVDHAVEIIETNTTFGEMDLPTPDDTNRIGVQRRKGDVQGKDFMETFGFRGVEFGNWNNQIERQQLMNAAYDGLMDLAEVLNIPPKAIALDGDLALAFGARGQGLSSAKAHYESGKAVINLTKMNGAGSLAHEWFHAMDHYFARQDGKASSEWTVGSDGTRSLKQSKNTEDSFVSHGFNYKSNVRQEVREAYTALIKTIFSKATTYVEDTEQADRFVARTKDDLAKRLDGIRKDLSDQKNPAYYKRNNKPASAEQLAEFDTISKQLLEGQGLDTDYRMQTDVQKRAGSWKARMTNDALEQISAIYKAVRGRSGFGSSNSSGTMDYLRGDMKRYAERLRMLASAQNGDKKVKNVPTDYAMNAKELDQGRGGDYWTTNHEMAARAFQGYVQDKISEKSGQSPFLNYGPENAGILTPWGFKRPFPRGDERKAINKALDKFVEVIKTKDTDKGVALFSRTSQPRTPFVAQADEGYQSTLNNVIALFKSGDRAKQQLAGKTPIPISRTPVVLRQVLEDDGSKPFKRAEYIVGQGSTLYLKADNVHSRSIHTGRISKVVLDKLPQLLADPVAVFKSSPASEDARSFKVLIDAVDENGKPIIVGIKPNTAMQQLNNAEVHFQATIFPTTWDDIKRWNKDGALRYYNEKSLLASVAANPAREAATEVDTREGFDANIGEKASKVKVVKRGDIESMPEAAFSIGTNAKGMPKAEVQSIIDGIKSKWENSPPIFVVESMQDEAIPQHVRDLDIQLKDNGSTGDPVAFISRGKVFILSTMVKDTNAVHEALFHETLGHFGLRGTYGNSLEKILDQIVMLRPKEVVAKAKAYGFDVKSKKDLQRAAEEVLAEMAQTKPEIGFVKRAIAAIRKFFRDIGFNIKVTDEDIIANYILPARRYVENGGNDIADEFINAVANNGGFDGNGTMFSRQSNLTPEWESPEESKMDDTIRALQNKHIDLKRVTENIIKAGNEISDRWNAYLQEELYHGRAAKRTQDFLKQDLEPLINEMRERGVEMADFEEYLWMRHAEERNVQIAKVNPDMKDGGSGIKTEDARAYMAELSDKNKADYVSLAKRIDAINRKTRQALIDYGLESVGTINKWEKAYKNYVPLMREDMEQGGSGTGTGFKVKGNSTKRATGSNRAVVDIIAHVAQQYERVITRGEKNRVSTALIGLATLNPNKDFWEVDTPPTVTDVSKATGLVVTRTDPNYKNRPNVVVARIVDKNGEIVERSVTFNEHNERAMSTASAINNLDQDQLLFGLGVLAKFTRYFASINTQYNPIFGVLNITRDVQGAVLNLSSTPIANKKAEVFAHTPKALWGIYSDVRTQRKTGTARDTEWAKLFEEFQREGGQTGYRDMFSKASERSEALRNALDPTWWKDSKIGKVISVNGVISAPEQWMYDKTVKPIFDWLSDYNTSLENAVRLSVYKVAIDNGQSKQQAASIAKNISVNFNRKGQAATNIGALYAFFNASVQGSARIGETVLKRENGKLNLSSAGKKIVYGGMLLGAMQALLLAAAGYDDDEPPEFIKDRNFIIPTFVGGKYITIPMPLGYNVIPAFGRIMTEFAMSGGKDAPQRIVHMMDVLFDVTNPIGNAGLSVQTISPTFVDPIAALSENRDFSGQKIYREDFNGLNPTPGFTRSKDKAWDFSVAIARGINYITGGNDYKQGAISPTADQLEYLTGQFTGGVGREIIKAGTTANALTTGEDLPLYKVPLVGRFVGDTEGQSSQGAKFYDNVRKLNEFQAQLKGMRKDGLSTEQFKAENPEAKLYHFGDLALNQVSKLRKRQRLLKEKGGNPEKVAAIDERITGIMTKLNERVENAKEMQAN